MGPDLPDFPSDGEVGPDFPDLPLEGAVGPDLPLLPKEQSSSGPYASYMISLHCWAISCSKCLGGRGGCGCYVKRGI